MKKRILSVLLVLCIVGTIVVGCGDSRVNPGMKCRIVLYELLGFL